MLASSSGRRRRRRTATRRSPRSRAPSTWSMVPPTRRTAAASSPSTTSVRSCEAPTLERAAATMARMSAYIRDRFSVDVQIVEAQAPFLGDLDGAEIRLGRGQDAEAALFTLGHLFGHTVQWNLSERARTIGAREQGRYTRAELLEIDGYELEASRYGLQLLHEI